MLINQPLASVWLGKQPHIILSVIKKIREKAMTPCSSCTNLQPSKQESSSKGTTRHHLHYKNQRLFSLSIEKNLIPDLSFTITERAAIEDSCLRYRQWKSISMESNSPSFLHKAPALTFYKEPGQHSCPQRQCAVHKIC